jgi:hypothetical protein
MRDPGRQIGFLRPLRGRSVIAAQAMSATLEKLGLLLFLRYRNHIDTTTWRCATYRVPRAAALSIDRKVAR